MKIVKLVKLLCVFLAVWGGFDVITAASNDLQKFGGIAKIAIGIMGFTAARFFSQKRVRHAKVKPAKYQLSKPAPELIAQNRLPPQAHMQREVERIFGPFGWNTHRPDAPPHDVAVAASLLAHIKDQDLPKDSGESAQIATLFALYRVMCGEDTEALSYFTLFADKAAAHDLRYQVQTAREVHETYNAERKLHLAALAAWEEEGKISRYHDDEDLVGFLQDMPTRDIDLWHDVILGAEPYSRVDFAAIYWIAKQPECDQASISALISELSSMGYLTTLAESELKKGSTDFVDQISAIIKRWNTGFYTHQVLAYEHTDLQHAQARFDQNTHDLKQLLGRAPWPMPQGLFRKFEGRKTDASTYFSHNNGLCSLPPAASDYITYLKA